VANENSGAPLLMSAVLGRYLLMSAGLPLGALAGVVPHGFESVNPPDESGVQEETNVGEFGR